MRVEPLVYTINETADVLHVSRATVYRLIDAGQLRAVHVGRVLRVPIIAVDAYLAPVEVAS